MRREATALAAFFMSWHKKLEQKNMVNCGDHKTKYGLDMLIADGWFSHKLIGQWSRFVLLSRLSLVVVDRE